MLEQSDYNKIEEHIDAKLRHNEPSPLTKEFMQETREENKAIKESINDVKIDIKGVQDDTTHLVKMFDEFKVDVKDYMTKSDNRYAAIWVENALKLVIASIILTLLAAGLNILIK